MTIRWPGSRRMHEGHVRGPWQPCAKCGRPKSERCPTCSAAHVMACRPRPAERPPVGKAW